MNLKLHSIGTNKDSGPFIELRRDEIACRALQL